MGNKTSKYGISTTTALNRPQNGMIRLRNDTSSYQFLNNNRRKSTASNDYIRAPIIATQKIYIALGDYQAQSFEEISFKKGDEMELISALKDSLFMMVRLMDGSGHGFVPIRLVAEKDSLRTKEWFHGNISRAQAEQVVMAPENCLGSFIVRNSEHIPNGFALTVKNFDYTKDVHVKNYRIKRNAMGHYYISVRDSFRTLQELISFYQNHVTQIHLVRPCPKQEVNRRHSFGPNQRSFTSYYSRNMPTTTRPQSFSAMSRHEVVERRPKTEAEGNVQLRALNTESLSEREFLEGAINMFRSNKIVYLYGVCEGNNNVIN